MTFSAGVFTPIIFDLKFKIMKIYNINPEKSKIKWTSHIGDQEIQGELKPHHGKLISELGEIVEGNISVDLKSLKIVNSTLSQKQIKRLENTIKSSPLLDDDNAIVEYKFEEVFSENDHELIKGLLMVSNQAFGINMIASFSSSDNELSTDGEIKIQKSNPVLISELDNIFKEDFEDDKSIQSFDLECHLIATVDN
jgi:hypothetical protein